MGVFWGLLSAVGYGSADFIASRVSARITAFRALFYIHFVSGALLAVLVLLTGIPADATAGAVGLAALLGAANTFGTLLLYRALSIGKISITSPVVSTFGGIALFLSLLAGDKISSGGVFSLVLMLVGVVMVSVVRADPQAQANRAALRGLPEAVVSAVLLGINFWGLQFVVRPLGPYLPTLIGRLMTILILPLLFRPLHQSIAFPPRSLWLRIVVVAVVTTMGEVAYNVGVQGTTPGIVAVLSSLFSPVTVLLALIFLHEKLARHQWIGVAFVFVATILIGYYQNFN